MKKHWLLLGGAAALFLLIPRKAEAALPLQPIKPAKQPVLNPPAQAQPAKPAEPGQGVPVPKTPASEVIKSEPLTDVDKSYVVYETDLNKVYAYAMQSNNPIVWQAAADRLASAGDMRAQAFSAKLAAM